MPPELQSRSWCRCRWKVTLWLGILALLFSTLPAQAQTSSNSDREDSTIPTSTSVPFGPLIVGLTVNGRPIRASLIVKGAEDGAQALNFKEWLIPLDAVLQAIQATSQQLPGSILEIRSPVIVARLDLALIPQDPEIGLALTPAAIEDRLGIPVSFNLEDFALEFTIPELVPRTTAVAEEINIEGLPLITPPATSLTQLNQSLTYTDRGTTDSDSRGDLAVVGRWGAGSYFFQLDQTDVTDFNQWALANFQYLHQQETRDLLIGSQTAFWPQGDTFWGLTRIHRQGFSPSRSRSVSTAQGLQADELTRTISGTAPPGTLVQLTQPFSNEVVAEMLVDESGIYRFANLSINTRSQTRFELLLFPEGKLTTTPEVREVMLQPQASQLPAGSHALIYSLGVERNQPTGNSFLGAYEDLETAGLQRWGVSETLTLGLGLVYQEQLQGLGELFYSSEPLHLRLALALLTATDPDISLDWEPSRHWRTRFTSGEGRSRLSTDWQVAQGIRLFSNWESDEGTELGTQLSRSWGPNVFTSLRSSIEADKFRFSLRQRLHRTRLNLDLEDQEFTWEVEYAFQDDPNRGHFLTLRQEDRPSSKGSLSSLLYEYESPDNSGFGDPLWRGLIGYGFGSEGSGPELEFSTTAIPGLLARAAYRSATATSDESSFTVELLSSFNLQAGISPGDQNTRDLQTQGGLMLIVFFDQNNNQHWDDDEPTYADSELMLILNNRPLTTYRPDQAPDRLLVPLDPDTYRLDFDPSGYPIDWQPQVSSLAVKVDVGSYTVVTIPLRLSYTVTGEVTTADGAAVAGARVVAERVDGTQQVFSITNGAGVFFLEQLFQGTYKLRVNDQIPQPAQLTLTEDQDAFLELNLEIENLEP